MGRHTNLVNRAAQSGTVTVTTTASSIGLTGVLPRLTYGIDVHAFQHVGTGTSDITPAITGYTKPKARVYRVVISATGTPDQFDWFFKESRGPTSDQDPAASGWSAGATGVAIIGGAMTLNEGVTVTWTGTTGHTLADEWRFTAKRPELHPAVMTAHFQNLDATNKISLASLGGVTRDATTSGGWVLGPEEVLSLNWARGDLSRILWIAGQNTVLRVWEEGIG